MTVTADDKSKVYGAADPALTYPVSGLVYGDGASVVGGVVLATATGASATAGAHPITATGGTSANYTITDVGGMLSVAKAPLTVTADDKSKVYGAADPALTYTPGGTLYYGDGYSVIGGVTLSTATGAAATVGDPPDRRHRRHGRELRDHRHRRDADRDAAAAPRVDRGHATLGKKHQVTGVVVAFSGILGTVEQATGSYRLVIAGKKNAFTARNAKVVVPEVGRLRRDAQHGDADAEPAVRPDPSCPAPDRRPDGPAIGPREGDKESFLIPCDGKKPPRTCCAGS